MGGYEHVLKPCTHTESHTYTDQYFSHSSSKAVQANSLKFFDLYDSMIRSQVLIDQHF